MQEVKSGSPPAFTHCYTRRVSAGKATKKTGPKQKRRRGLAITAAFTPQLHPRSQGRRGVKKTGLRNKSEEEDQYSSAPSFPTKAHRNSPGADYFATGIF